MRLLSFAGKAKTFKTKLVNLTAIVALLTNSLALPLIVSGQAAALPNPLLAAPTNLTPVNGTVTNNPTFTDSWSVVPGAVNYEYQVSTSESGGVLGPIGYSDSSISNPGGYTIGASTVTRVNGPTVDGSYYWQVRAIDADGNTGAWSAIDKTTVDTTKPVVTVTPVAGSLIHGTQNFAITINDANPANPANNHIFVYAYNTGSPFKSKGASVDLSSGSGTFTLDTTLVGDGNTWLDVGQLKDAAGNLSGTSDTYFQNYNVDNTAPAVPNLTFPADGVLRHSADTNHSDWSAVTDANGPVTYNYESAYDAGFTNIAYGPSSTGTATTILNPGEPETTYYWRVQACDAAGNCSAWSTARSITIDNTAPVVSVTPAAGNLIHGTTTFNITVNDAHVKPTDSVYVYLYNNDGSKSNGHTVTLTNGHGTFTVNTNLLNDGKATLDVGLLYDLAGNPTVDQYHPNGIDSYFKDYTIDNTAPVVTVDSFFTTNPLPALTGTVDDKTAGVVANINGHSYTATVNQTANGSGTYNWTANVTNHLNDHVYSVTATATDAATNSSTGTGSVTVDAHQPGTPTILTLPNNGYTNDSTPLLSWLPAFSPTNPPVSYKVQVSTSNTFASTVVDHSGTSLFYTSPHLNDGTYYERVQATDTLGGQSAWSNINAFTVDTVKPVVAITAPANHATVKGSVPVTGTITDANPALYSWTVTNSHGHIVYYHLYTGGSVNPLSLSALADGSYTVYLTSVDAAGNESTDSIQITVDNTAPAVAITTPSANAAVRHTVHLTGTVTDTNLTSASWSIKNSHNHTVYSHSFSTTGNDWNTWFVSDGTYTIYLTGTDAAGNTTTVSEQVSVDNTAPVGVHNQSPANGTHTTTANQTAITWTAGYDAHGPITYYYEASNSSAVHHDGSFQTPVYQSDPLTTNSIPTLNTPEGVYYWHVRAVDTLGNSSAWTHAWKITVDNTAPTAALSFPTPGPAATSFTVTFSEAVKSSEATDPANYFLNNWPGAGGSGPLTGNATVSYNHFTHVATVTFTNPDWYVSAEQQWGVQNIHDLAGNDISPDPTTAYSTPLVDPGTPGAPTTTSPNNSQDVVWDWTAATDPGGVNASGVKGYWYTLTDSDSTVVVASTFTTALTATTTVPADGSYTLSVYAEDNAGNQGDSVTGDVVVDTLAPDLTIDGSTGTDTTPTITGTTSDATDVVTVDGSTATVDPSANGDGSHNWSFTLPTQSIGTHTITVVSTDLAGNATTETADVVVSEVPVVTPAVTTTTGGGTAPKPTVTVTPNNNQTATTGTVLGDSTTKPSTDSNGQVQGDSTDSSNAKTDSSKSSNFLGLGWWWILILAAILGGLWWFIAGRRRDSDEEA